MGSGREQTPAVQNKKEEPPELDFCAFLEWIQGITP